MAAQPGLSYKETVEAVTSFRESSIPSYSCPTSAHDDAQWKSPCILCYVFAISTHRRPLRADERTAYQCINLDTRKSASTSPKSALYWVKRSKRAQRGG